jgi:membrane-associated phospholipid phosphatase
MTLVPLLYSMLHWLETIDKDSLLYLNRLELLPRPIAHTFFGLFSNYLTQQAPVLVPFIITWRSAAPDRRNRMILGLVACCVVVMTSVSLQYHLHTHLRPFLDPSLQIAVTAPGVRYGWDRVWSFPSDTAAAFSAIAAIVMLEDRFLGMVALSWVFLVGVARVAGGYHYPSDLLAGIILGVGTVMLFELLPWPKRVIHAATRRLPPVAVDAAVLIFLMDAYALFPGLQGIWRFLKYH